MVRWDLTASFPIVHLKETSHHLVLELMKKSHLFVMPSHFEGFCLGLFGGLGERGNSSGWRPRGRTRSFGERRVWNPHQGEFAGNQRAPFSPILADPCSYSERADRGRKHWVDSYSPAAVAQMFYDELSPVVLPSPVTETMPMSPISHTVAAE